MSTTTMSGLRPPPGELEEAVREIRGKIAEARDLERMGYGEASFSLASEARAAAEALAYRPLVAEAKAQAARALDGRQTCEARSEAENLYFDALDIAEAERHDVLAAMIWSRLVLLAIQMDCDTQRAHDWWRRADAAVRRIGDPALERAKLHYLRSEICYREGGYCAAENEARQAIAVIAQSSDGEPTLQQRHELGLYHGALAKSLEPQSQSAKALGYHEQALKITGDVLDASHPDVVKLQMNYGLALKRAGQMGRARSVLDAALASMALRRCATCMDAGVLQAYLSDVNYEEGKLEDAIACGHASRQILEGLGAPAHRCADAYTCIGNAELKRGNFPAALEMYNDALALRRRGLGSEHYQIGVNEGSIAEALVRLARYDEAIEHAREADRILVRGAAHGNAVKAWVLGVLGEALVGQQELGEGVTVLERALLLFEQAPQPSNQAHAMRALARALRALGTDLVRAGELASRSRALFAALGIPDAPPDPPRGSAANGSLPLPV